MNAKQTSKIELAPIIHKLKQARTNLLIDEPFFGTLALRLEFEVCEHTNTLSTDGKAIRYNPEWIQQVSVTLAQCEVCHEVLHNSQGDAWRRGNRDPHKWNDACDYRINYMLEQCGYGPAMDEAAQLGKPYLRDRKYDGMTPEEIYTLLPDSNGKGDGKGCQCFEDGQASGDDPTTIEVEWKVATLQAAQVANMAGKLPGVLKDLIKQLKETKVDWKAALRKFVQTCARADYSWKTPNRRYISSGLYLPELRSETLPPIVVVIDTSGSTQHVQAQFASEVRSIVSECLPERTIVIYCDTDVQQVDEYELGELPELKNIGGGGTSFVPPFEYVAAHDIEPACLIYLTDLEGEFPDAPDYPVLWASVTKHVAPFGETIYISGE